jgi:hypothetical protein
VLEQDKERSSKHIDAARGHLKHLGLTEEQTSLFDMFLSTNRGARRKRQSCVGYFPSVK